MTFTWPSLLAAAISPLRPPNAAAEVAVAAFTPELVPVVVAEPHAVINANVANATPARANLFTCLDISLWCPPIFEMSVAEDTTVSTIPEASRNRLHAKC